MPASDPSRRAMLRSQSGAGSSQWLSVCPLHPQVTLRALRMQVALRRRLRWPLPLGPRRCNGQACRKQLDAWGHHLAACMRSGRVRRRARPLERAWAGVFREAGARVLENVLLRNMGVPGIGATDGRRLEELATGLPLHRGVPLAVDATMLSALHADGRPWPKAAEEDGVVIKRGEEAKVRSKLETPSLRGQGWEL